MSNEVEAEKMSGSESIWETVDQFEVALRSDSTVRINDFLPPSCSPNYPTILAELLRIRLEHDWSQGQPTELKRLFDEFPNVHLYPDVVAAVAFEGFRQRKLHHQPVEAETYRERFDVDSSNWLTTWEIAQSALSGQENFNRSSQQGAISVDTVRTVAADTDAPRVATGREMREIVQHFPGIGVKWGPFQIVEELGSGSFSRVYAARQADLASRYVALKITGMPLGESQRLAKLQHANIMPLYSVHQHDGLFALCMPLLGAVTIKEIVDRRAHSSETQSPRDVWDSVVRRNLKLQADFDVDAESRQLNETTAQADEPPLTFNDRVLRMARQLAWGLEHAHSRGILHRDIKPANILLAWDGTPLLMDFNLSRETKVSVTAQAGGAGGTWAYMAPEQIRAMWWGDTKLLPTTDIFSLGAVLFELFTKQLPYPVDQGSVEDAEQTIASRSVCSEKRELLKRCVSPTVAAIVLKCLEHRPEQRYATAAELAEDLDLHIRHRPVRHVGNPSLAERWSKWLRRHPSWRGYSALSSLSLIVFAVLAVGLWSLFSAHRRQAAIDALEAFQRDLHQAEAQLLFPDGGAYTAGIQSGYRALSHFKIGQSSNWDRDSLFTWLTTDDQTEVQHQAKQLINLLAELETNSNPEQKIDGEFRDFRLNLFDAGESELAGAMRLYRERKYREATRVINEQLKQYPQRFALWFLLAKCEFELREYRIAESHFARCCLIDDQSSLSYFARGLCHYWMQNDRDALAMFVQAIEIDPNLAAAYFNQALVHERQRQYDQALMAIEQALKIEPETTRYLMIRSRIKRGLGNPTGADHDLNLVKSLEPRTPEDWIMRGIARLNESPDDALSDFRQATRWRSTATTARQNMAHVLSERLGKPEEAIATLTELLNHEPGFTPALSGRAVLYARIGQTQSALADIEACLQLDVTPAINYQIGCVYSLLSAKEPEFAAQAIKYLGRALRPAYGGNIIGNDVDLKPLERNAIFRRMKQGVQTIMEQNQ
ncbi:MAG TPA: protein kinase [Pirellulaceae bacterium]|nr:protein kinase [Pirellulaceae bacterium]HMO93838.1 protein kinase [Pirellulaceae bacterium]HMP71134.1 protein kinase [Pirellulaceae bacterium]